METKLMMGADLPLFMKATTQLKEAEMLTVDTEEAYVFAGELLKQVKELHKKNDESVSPAVSDAYKTYKELNEKKKALLEPTKKAETILKTKMAEYQLALEKKHREEEERMKRLVEEEMARKLEEAVEAEEAGDHLSADYAMAEAEMLDNMAGVSAIPTPKAKASGISQSRGWVIKNIDLSKLPDEFAGVLIRPADEKAIMNLIKASKGSIRIPGVEYEETVKISVRAS